MAAGTPIYVHSPGPGPYSLRSLTQRRKRPARPNAVANVGLGPKRPTPGGPPTDAQLAQQQVSAAFDPVVKQIADALNQRASAQQRAITGYSKTLADLMGSYGPAARQAYSGAAASQSAIDASLAATRQGQGASAQTDLAAKLAQIHADPSTAARISGGLSGDLAGEAQATAGRGAANLAMLLGEGAHAQDYGAKLPGIAAGIGLGATQRAQGQITSELKQALSELGAKRPEAFQAALSNISTTRQRQQQLDLENKLAAKKYGLDVVKTKASIAQGDARVDIARTNALTAQERAAISAAQGDRRIDIAQQNANTAAKRATVAAQKAAGKAHPTLTGNQAARIAEKAAKDAEDFYHGIQKPDGTVVAYTETWQDAVKMLTQRYPSLGRKAVLALVNSWYKPGEYGRPAKTAAVGSAGAPGPVQGRDYRNGA